MKRFVAAGSGIVLLATVFLVLWVSPGSSRASSDHQISLTVSTWNESDSLEPGDTCGNDLLVGGPEYSIYRQVVVRDASGTVVATGPLNEGVVTEGDWGLLCEIDLELALPDSAFFTFDIPEDDFTYTASLDQLTRAGWVISLQPDS